MILTKRMLPLLGHAADFLCTRLCCCRLFVLRRMKPPDTASESNSNTSSPSSFLPLLTFIFILCTHTLGKHPEWWIPSSTPGRLELQISMHSTGQTPIPLLSRSQFRVNIIDCFPGMFLAAIRRLFRRVRERAKANI